MKSILLADNHSVIRRGIKALIYESLPHYEIDETGSEGDLINKVKTHVYQLVLLDLALPDTDFSKLMEWILIISPSTNILIFTEQPEEIYGLRCLYLGAKGFLEKSASSEEIILAISKVLNGEKYLSAKLAGLLVENFQKPNTSENPFDRLSQREMEIATQLERGKSLTEICDILKIQYSTVNTYKRRIFEKLNVHSVLQLARLMEAFNR